MTRAAIRAAPDPGRAGGEGGFMNVFKASGQGERPVRWTRAAFLPALLLLLLFVAVCPRLGARMLLQDPLSRPCPCSTPRVNDILDIKPGHKELPQAAESDSVFKPRPDVFYPPEEYLAREGKTLESHIQSLRDTAPKNRNSSVANTWGTTPLTGNIHIPVFLVEFTDKPHTLSATDISAAFNSPNYLNGQGISVSKYFTKQSYGALNVTFDVYGWQTAPQTYSYYSQGNARNLEMMIDAINMHNPIIDYCQYDNDGDGRIDGFVIIYAGKAGVAPNGIWPQARIFQGFYYSVIDGKYFGNIAAVPELGRIGNQFEIPITTHEFAHVLGLMDLYSIGPNGSGDGPIKNFTMMNFEDHPYCLDKPINLDVWSRYFFGWIDPIVLTTDSPKEISLRSVNDYPDAVILKNNNMTAREFFIIENRHRNTNDPNNLDNCMFNYESTTYGGFAIYHVDENKIEAHYPNNWINWDPDGNWYDDTVSHPGIMYEKNYISNYFGGCYNTGDMYFNAAVEGCDSFRWFDEFKRICTHIYAIDDSDTHSYSGVLNPLIRFQALSPPNQPTMTARMLVWDETPLPVAEPAPGIYQQPVQVQLSNSSPDAVIYYTTDGSEPTYESPVYSAPISVPEHSTLLLKAIARIPGYYVSESLSASYEVTGAAATPVASHASGTLDYGAQVSLSCATGGAMILYTLDGGDPLDGGFNYVNPIPVYESVTLKARAFRNNYNPSGLAVYNYQVMETAVPVSSHESGHYLIGTQISLSCDTPEAEIRYTTDGSLPNQSSALYENPLILEENFTLKAMAFRTSYAPSEIATYNYQVMETAIPVSSLESGHYLWGTQITLSCDTPEAEIRYTTDGSLPNQSSALYENPLSLEEDFTLKAMAFRTGWVPSPVAVYHYSTDIPENKILSFTFPAPVEVLSTQIDHDANTIGITVSYSSFIGYVAPEITVSDYASVSPDPALPQNFYNQVVEYTVTALSGQQRTYAVTVTRVPAVYPVEASLPGGTYSGPQQVVLSCATPDAVIIYTLDGSEPQPGGTAYTDTLTINTSLVLTARAFLYTGPPIGSSGSDRGGVTLPRSANDEMAVNALWLGGPTLREEYDLDGRP